MSAENGHLPEGATIATLEMLRKANVAYRELPRLSEQLGQKVMVKIRAIRPVTYMEFMPPQPAEASEWPKETEARAAAYVRWLEALPAEERARRKALTDDLPFKVIAAGVIEPEVTVETARDFASDADLLSEEILIFSGIFRRREPEKKEPSESDPAPVAV